MEKFPLAIIVDSTGVDTNRLGIDQHIYMQPLSINFGSATFIDVNEMSPAQFYETLVTNPNHPTTSQPAIGAVVEQINTLLESYENIICISVSSAISGTYNGFVSAKEMTSTDRVHVIDTLSTGPGEWLLAEKALTLQAQGQQINSIVQQITDLSRGSQVFVFIDTLTYLAKSGRLSGATALIGNLIQMKTNIKFENGKPIVIDRIRTAKKALYAMVDSALADLSETTNHLYVGYAEAKRPTLIDDVRNYILERRPSLSIREIIIPAVLGNNSGPGGIGICYVNNL